MSDISQLCCTMGDFGYSMPHSIKILNYIFDQFLFFNLQLVLLAFDGFGQA